MPSGKLDADGLDHGERSPAQKTKNGLRAARKRRGMSDWGPWKDNKLMAVVDKYDDAAFASLLSYKVTSGTPHTHVLLNIHICSINRRTIVIRSTGCPSIRTGPHPRPLTSWLFNRAAQRRI